MCVCVCVRMLCQCVVGAVVCMNAWDYAQVPHLNSEGARVGLLRRRSGSHWFGSKLAGHNQATTSVRVCRDKNAYCSSCTAKKTLTQNICWQ